MQAQTQTNTQTQFRTIPNVAQYGGADWSNLLKVVPGLTADKAKQMAMADDKVTFFFFCKQGMTLAPCGPDKSRTFQAGDAVFFSGEPWYGSAPQCDMYRKTKIEKVANAAQYKGADWNSVVKTVHGTTAEAALQTALADPKITFFFFCRGGMVLEPTAGNPQRNFSAGDAVFFSGDAWLGSAPQCDTYRLQTYGSGK